MVEKLTNQSWLLKISDTSLCCLFSLVLTMITQRSNSATLAVPKQLYQACIGKLQGNQHFGYLERFSIECCKFALVLHYFAR